MEYHLEARFDKRQNFYGKAIVKEYQNGLKELYSYGTLVAIITENNEPRYLGQWSQTTTRHQKEFFKQNGFEDNIKKYYYEEK